MKTIRILAILTALLLSCSGALAEAPSVESLQARIEALEEELETKTARIEALEAALDEAHSALWDRTDHSAVDTNVAAEFKGGVITAKEARNEYEYRAYYYNSFGLGEDDDTDSVKLEVLESLVEDAILRQKAEEFGLYELSSEDMAALEAQAQAAFEENVAYYMAYRASEGKTDAELRQETIEYLAGEDYTLEGVLETLRNQTWRDRLRAYITRDVMLADDDIEAYYLSELTAEELAYTADPLEYEYARMDGIPVLWNPEGYRRVKNILIGFRDEDAFTYAQLQLDLENAQNDGERALLFGEMDALYEGLMPIVSEVLDRLQAGEDFMLLVDEFSADEASRTEPSRSTGYFVSAESQVYPTAFRDAAMAMESIGDISEPVRGDYGINILYYEADVVPGAVPYEEAWGWLTERALESLRNKVYNETVEGWLEEAEIAYYPENF